MPARLSAELLQWLEVNQGLVTDLGIGKIQSTQGRQFLQAGQSIIADLAAVEIDRLEVGQIGQVGQAWTIDPGSLQIQDREFHQSVRPCMVVLGIGHPEESECLVSDAGEPQVKLPQRGHAGNARQAFITELRALEIQTRFTERGSSCQLPVRKCRIAPQEVVVSC